MYRFLFCLIVSCIIGTACCKHELTYKDCGILARKQDSIHTVSRMEFDHYLYFTIMAMKTSGDEGKRNLALADTAFNRYDSLNTLSYEYAKSYYECKDIVMRTSIWKLN